MSTIITAKHKIFQASLYKAGFSDTNDNLYLFIGKSDPWSDPDNLSISDTTPPTTVDTIKDEMVRWNTMIAMKKIIESQVSHGIPRHDWDVTGNTKYVEYSDNDPNLFNHPTDDEIEAAADDYTAGSFFVVTDEFNVYKCISNGAGAFSTEKPTGTSTLIIETADGYKWKYMFTVSTSEALKWVTPDFIPVKVLSSDDGSNQWDVQAAAVDGSVEHIRVLTGGSGYVNVHSGTAQDGGGANTIKLSGAASSSNDVYNGCTVFIESGVAAGQFKTIIDYDGGSRLATVDSNWTASVPPDHTSTYSVMPKITISGGGGSNLAARSFVVGGVVTKISVINSGSGYRFADSVTVTVSGGGGTGATARAVVSPIGGHGKNPIDELGGFFTIMNVKLDFNESDFITKNDYRILGIVTGVYNFGGTVLSTANTLRATKMLTCNALSSSFDEDEEIVGAVSGAHGIVIQSDEASPNATIQYYQNKDTAFVAFQVGETVTGQLSGATATVTVLNNPEIEKYKGRIIHVEQRRPLMRSDDQIEEITTVIEH